MKKKKFFAKATFTAAIAITALLSSCNDDETVNNSNNIDRVAVEFASAETMVQTRVDGSGWATGDPIGVYMVANTTNTIAESAENIQYIAKGAGSGNIDFNVVTAEKTIYYPVTTPNKVDFIAYHPYQPTLTNWMYKVDVTTQTSQTVIDLLWAKANNGGGGYTKTTSAAVPLNFTHRLAKLYLTVSAGNGVTSLNGLQVSINGTNTKADCDIKTGALINESTPANIIPLKNASAYQYEAILLPANLGASHTVTFTIGNDVYTWKISDSIATLVSGKKYNYAITLNKHNVSITGSITDWTSGGTGTGAAD
jgi:hypothetical protein